MAKRILILGSGGREHALAHCLRADNEVIVAPGNAGIANEFECLKLPAEGVAGHVRVAKQTNPDLVVIGPEEPLALGIVDALKDVGVTAFGPSKACAALEASKSVMKSLCEEANIPTANYDVFDNSPDVARFLRGKEGRYVVKADGLCAGKGVMVCDDVNHTLETAREFLGVDSEAKFGVASKRIVVEQFLPGNEISVIGICDGDSVNLFAPVRDHKRLLEGDGGPNTGGMGVVGPITKVHGLSADFSQQVKERVFLPTLRAMKARGTPYRGFLYAGLMVNDGDFSLLEFNVRLGDPEAQALLFGTKLDYYGYLKAVADGEQLPCADHDFADQMEPTAVVVMASRGYPERTQVGDAIVGLEKAKQTDRGQVFFASVATGEGNLVTSGGRVLSLAASGDTIASALKTCYQMASHIDFAGAQIRKDIGHTILAAGANANAIV